MRKLVLDLDDLEVESFEVSGEGEEGGTVRGHDDDGTNSLDRCCTADAACSDTWCPTNCLSAPCFCPI